MMGPATHGDQVERSPSGVAAAASAVASPRLPIVSERRLLYGAAVMPKPTRVLVVDDDPEIRDYLALALSGPDCEVALAAGPDEVAAAPGCDVALVDLLLEGGETAEPLVARLAGQGIRVVVMTGLSSDAPAVRGAWAAGAAAILQKPFTLTALRDEVARC